MSEHEIERTMAVIACGFFLTIGGLIGATTFWSCVKFDTFDCTNTCGGKHSIQYYVENNKVCYCEVK
jgi:hypothetical protein